ncbi:hypothetical protein PPTG_08456 [Phytophthora nicotianae INRA-310]|uniref:Uncharacterized protein n=5 Tax=Phytophthora nicotianae TaxID=4792 RepID=W2QKM1_PHYN3|nr:hypothetical protein PPTG_08456 [Phytophthora nicotianae INRA-310]ETL46728.1 hypothetical protein L916_03441 [Phytophthora nicotianae]ETN13722.1 hypothetical protein PPTG_08456 [Phytophthora nicotianae INRA-310]
MEIESSGPSVDAGSEHDDADDFDYIHHSDEEGCGLADAFKQFEAQAEKRTLELLRATEEQLFQLPLVDSTPASGENKGTNAEEGSVPAYVYMSDQYRFKRPPQFQHWQQNFQYLQVTGSRMLEGESMEHVQLIPMESKGSESISGDMSEIKLQVEGVSCLKEPTPASRENYEEIILCDGVMEEALEHDENTDDGEADLGNFSPNTSYVEEVLDSLTMDCFSSTVAPMLTSLYKTMLEKQQHRVRSAREEREAAANRTIEEQIAIDKARQLRLEQEALEEAARMEEMERKRQEEERKENERRELLKKQQLEENDEEEVKIKTLAYSHMREWYQPNKKCFSHRGRQLTYLKPVLQTKEAEDISMPEIQERLPPPNSDRKRTRQSNVLKKPRSIVQKPQPEWVTGGALTNDKLCDISWVKKIARPPVNPPPSPTRSRRRRKNENQKDDAVVQLPIIPKPEAKASNATTKSTPVRHSTR